MIEVTASNIEDVVLALRNERYLSLDTETTGLDPYKESRAFSVIMATEKEEYYFNFNREPDHLGVLHPYLSIGTGISALAPILENREGMMFMHNAKFDMAMLKQTFGLEVARPIVDVWTLDRLYYNESLTYELAAVAKRHRMEKSGVVDEYIKKYKLYDSKKNPLYNKVPFGIIFQYGCKDARITFDLAKRILSLLDGFHYEPNWPHCSNVLRQENALLPVLAKMEETGVQLDEPFVAEAIHYYTDFIAAKESEFERLTGLKFSKGMNTFKEVFKDEKLTYSDKNNPVFDAKAMKKFKHPAAKVVVEWSEGKKQLDYFQNFYKLMDLQNVLHATFAPSGTATGRFSSRSPNLQNLTKPDKYKKGVVDNFAVRKAFVPRPGYFFVSIDYEQIEYRVMLDMAGALGLIERVKGGLDVHEATAQDAGCTREQAKTVNFLTLYGGGIKKLAEALGCSESEARRIQNSIFDSAPEIKRFIRNVIETASRRGYIFNQWGRRYHFSDSRFAYKAPNYLIQGTCADILKKAMIAIDAYIRAFNLKTRMILTIHDELIFEVAYGEEQHVQAFAGLMTAAYPHRHLPLLVDIEWSDKNLAEKQPWSTFESRNKVQREDTCTA